ncbi:SET domain-containing protein-lysine N-methyltransferase [Candidatus Woesearchaeota archaeon CG10_big_fil_rev_8_21_14_0_10_36_11]|nr:MAG: SET domain-containing protein-lysine N-methyltransferase [Candidatus Woesearchaeota archaeon CG10_big_fil_rev_8_21_14_0_10_36_11]
MSEKELVIVANSKIEGKGVFAQKDIPKGTKVIEYVGIKITKKEAERVENPRYIFNLNKRYDIDGNVPWNKAGFINHSCDPNCEPINISNSIWIIALRDIKNGEELRYNYGYDLVDYENWPCNCGSPQCIGYIVAEEHWHKIVKK